ncbi:tyrosine-type recombinase/integrase, partial [Salmonella enterica]|nr:tyrosine-type recombinase/integrase [Salmonella enterica]
AWNRIANSCGFTDVTPHTLRHTFASKCDDLGLTTPTISALLGHSSGNQTSKYIHKVDEALIASAAKVVTHLSDLLFWKQRGLDREIPLEAFYQIASSEQAARTALHASLRKPELAPRR